MSSVESKKLLANDQTAIKNYVGIYLPGGPCHHPFYPLYATDDEWGENDNPYNISPYIGTQITDGAISYKTLKNLDGSPSDFRKFLPPVWNEYLDLANQSYFIRGISLPPAHFVYVNHFVPDSGKRGIHAIPSIANDSLPFACAQWGVSNIPFNHDSKRPAIISNYRLSGQKNNNEQSVQVPKDILNPFLSYNVKSINEALQEKVDAALNKLKMIGENYNINSKVLHNERIVAKELFTKSLEELLGSFQNKFEAYGNTISTALNTPISGIDDQEDISIGDGDKFNGFTSTNNNSTLNSYLGTSFNDELQTSMALADILLNGEGDVGQLTNSLLLTGGKLYLSGRENFLQNDAHGVGSIPSTFYFTKYYQCLLACLNKFRSNLIKNGKFRHTVIHITSEFGRSPKADESGSDHGGDAGCALIINGGITDPGIFGHVDLGAGDQDENYPGYWGQADGGGFQTEEIQGAIEDMLGLDSDQKIARSMSLKEFKGKKESS